jgi:hypothetical protein
MLKEENHKMKKLKNSSKILMETVRSQMGLKTNNRENYEYLVERELFN